MKKLIFYATGTYMIIIVIAMIVNVATQPKTVNFGTKDSYEEKMTELEIKVNEMEDSNFKNGIKNLITISKNTCFVGNTKLKHIYQLIFADEQNWFASSRNVFDNCNITDTAEAANLMMASGIQMNELLQRYMYSYILKISISPQNQRHANLETIENNIKKDLEIATIELLIEEGDNHE